MRGVVALLIATLGTKDVRCTPVYLDRKLVPGVNDTGFGRAIAVGGTGDIVTLAVAAPDLERKRGGVFVFACDIERMRCSALQPVVSLAGEGRPGDAFGTGLALSRDGTMLAIGAPGRNVSNEEAVRVGAGVIYTCRCSEGICGALSQPLTIPGARARDALGTALAVNGHGTVLAAGTPGLDRGTGAVFLFACAAGRCDGLSRMLRPSGALLPGAPLSFGRSIALSTDGHRLVIGAPQRCCEDSHDIMGYTFTASCEGVTCDQPLLLVRDGDSLGEYFGAHVASSDDGDFVAVSAHGRGGTTGAVYTAACARGVECTRLSPLVFSDGSRGDAFGATLAISGKGRRLRLIVGSPGRREVRLMFGCSPADGRCTEEAALLLQAGGAPRAAFGSTVACGEFGASSLIFVGSDAEAVYTSSLSLVEKQLRDEDFGQWEQLSESATRLTPAPRDETAMSHGTAEVSSAMRIISRVSHRTETVGIVAALLVFAIGAAW